MRNPQELEGIDDLIGLQVLDEPNILQSLTVRYRKEAIYTYTGPILIAVNPWKRVPLYGSDMVQMYLTTPLSSLAPHPFSVADVAYKNMLRGAYSVLMCGITDECVA